MFPRRLPADGDDQSLAVIKEKSDEMALCKFKLACFSSPGNYNLQTGLKRLREKLQPSFLWLAPFFFTPFFFRHQLVLPYFTRELKKAKYGEF